MSVLATLRPDEWNLPLFFHVLGAFVLIGALVTAASFLFAARRDGSLALIRLGFRSLLMVALPALIVTRLTAQWIASEEGLEDSDSLWITLGYISTEGGLLILVGATVAAWLAIRRSERSDGAKEKGDNIGISAGLVSFLIAIYTVMIWLMATKPD